MSGRNLPRSLAVYATVCLILSTSLLGQEPTGGGSLIKDITGGAAIIFRAPKDPVVHIASAVQTAAGGGKTKDKKQPPPKPAVRQQDPIIARANAARSAPKQRYADTEEQYRLRRGRSDDARGFAGREMFLSIKDALPTPQMLTTSAQG